MKEYLIESKCPDCGHGYAVVLYHVCDEMDDPNHNKCTDDCYPDERPFNPAYHDGKDLDTFLRCAKCESLNTEKQTEW